MGFHRCSSDPSLEAEVLNDVGHVFLDMFTFITKQGSIISRLLAVIGRLAFIASDYIPDHAIRTDELLFQMSMLAIASTRLSQCLSPIANSIVSSPSTNNNSFSIREKKAYLLLFKQVGLPWNKYKHIVNSNAFSWVDLTPNSILTNEDNNNALYWVYNGTIITENNNYTKHDDADHNNIVINQYTRNSFINFDGDDDQTTSLQLFKAGNDGGASLLKIDIKKLQKLMKDDGVLNESVQNLLFKMLKQTWTPRKNVTV